MSYEQKKAALRGLLELGQAGNRHPDAISYGVYRDCFDHRRVLAAISSDHAEALRLHRELIDDDVITAPRQTSRRCADGSRHNFQVQRIFAERAAAALAEIHDLGLPVDIVVGFCPNCQHQGTDEFAPWDEPEHLAAANRITAERRAAQAEQEAPE
jgi:crotonobetainyl-CoA:carnitine CoA-transferase CaiB-like acyl-CoA transferase